VQDPESKPQYCQKRKKKRQKRRHLQVEPALSSTATSTSPLTELPLWDPHLLQQAVKKKKIVQNCSQTSSLHEAIGIDVQIKLACTEGDQNIYFSNSKWID
jgi:hypothetical protein